MTEKFMKIGARHGTEAKGLVADESGRLGITRPPRTEIIGEIIEPHDENFKGVVGIFGHALFWQDILIGAEVSVIRLRGDYVYVATRHGELIKFNLDGNIQWNYSSWNGQISDIAFDNDGNIYIGSRYSGHIAKISNDGDELKIVRNMLKGNSNFSGIYCISDERDGFLYLGGSLSGGGQGKIMKISVNLDVESESDAESLIQAVTVVGSDLIVGQVTGEIYSLNLNNYTKNWSSTTSGAVEEFKYDYGSGKLYSVARCGVYRVDVFDGTLTTIKGLNNSSVEGEGRSLSVDFNGNLFVGTDGIKNVYKIDETGVVEWSLKSDSGRVLALEADKAGNVFIGSTDIKNISSNLQFKGYKLIDGSGD